MISKSRITIITIIIAMMLTLTACGSEMAGRYDLTVLEMGDYSMSGDELVQSNASATVEVKSNHKFVMKMEGEEPDEGKWKIKDDQLYFQVGDDKVECEFNKETKTLIMDFGGFKMTFEKVEE